MIPDFHLTALERVCDALPDTSTGLTGSEIGMLLAGPGIPDRMAGMTKRVRLSEAF